jgi:hypothetical protein
MQPPLVALYLQIHSICRSWDLAHWKAHTLRNFSMNLLYFFVAMLCLGELWLNFTLQCTLCLVGGSQLHPTPRKCLKRLRGSPNFMLVALHPLGVPGSLVILHGIKCHKFVGSATWITSAEHANFAPNRISGLGASSQSLLEWCGGLLSDPRKDRDHHSCACGVYDDCGINKVVAIKGETPLHGEDTCTRWYH